MSLRYSLKILMSGTFIQKALQRVSASRNSQGVCWGWGVEDGTLNRNLIRLQHWVTRTRRKARRKPTVVE